MPKACKAKYPAFKYVIDQTVPLKNILLKNNHQLSLILLLIIFCNTGYSQMITGVWKGKIGKQKAEVKIVQNGDSLTGTSYYYESGSNYRRYSIKGYFDDETNSAVWWDDQLIEEKSGRFSLGSGKVAFLSRADFNCPGGGEIMLDGKAGPKEHLTPNGEVHLDKTGSTNFTDEWDFVIDNYTVGANDPEIIDSIALIAFKEPIPQDVVIARPKQKPLSRPSTNMMSIPPIPAEKEAPPVVSKPATIEEKFVARTTKHVADIPLQGDSIELRFYDNAEIDGDSITLFLNQQLVFQHIFLKAKPYVVKLAVSDLNDTNELVMVAENLGRIPPNTSYMVAIVDDKRYEANLQSTEEVSAMIRLIKPKKE
jgi:hypothetical protein